MPKTANLTAQLEQAVQKVNNRVARLEAQAESVRTKLEDAKREQARLRNALAALNQAEPFPKLVVEDWSDNPVAKAAGHTKTPPVQELAPDDAFVLIGDRLVPKEVVSGIGSAPAQPPPVVLPAITDEDGFAPDL